MTNLCDFTVDGGAGDPQRRSGKTSAKLFQMPPLARRSSLSITTRHPSHGYIDSNPVT